MKKESDASQTVPDSVCELWRKGAALSWSVEELSKDATERECLLICFPWKVTPETHACVLCLAKVAGVIFVIVQTGKNLVQASRILKRHTTGFALFI